MLAYTFLHQDCPDIWLQRKGDTPNLQPDTRPIPISKNRTLTSCSRGHYRITTNIQAWCAIKVQFSSYEKHSIERQAMRHKVTCQSEVVQGPSSHQLQAWLWRGAGASGFVWCAVCAALPLLSLPVYLPCFNRDYWLLLSCPVWL